jgi:hypothetical protein
VNSRSNVALFIPLVLVNAIAIFGQAEWGYDHLTHATLPMGIAIAVLFAASVESIGFYLAVEAHAALMAGDASARLRMGSYFIGLLVGCLNYGHYAAAHYRPTPTALAFGLLSSISPWLWSIRSRSMNREQLRQLGQIDPRAVRFSMLRWLLFPVQTTAAFRAAVWAGIVQPAEAIAAADRRRASRHPGPAVKPFVTQGVSGKRESAEFGMGIEDLSDLDPLYDVFGPTVVTPVVPVPDDTVADPWASAIEGPLPVPAGWQAVAFTEPVPVPAEQVEPVPADRVDRDDRVTEIGNATDEGSELVRTPEPVSAVADIGPESVPAEVPAKRKPPVPDRVILATLRDPERVPRRSDGTVPIRDVERRWPIGQERAIKLLKLAGVYRSGDGEPVPADDGEPVPDRVGELVAAGR